MSKVLKVLLLYCFQLQICMLVIAPDNAEATGKTVTVRTQAQRGTLSDSSVTKIVISTTEKC